MRSLLVLVLVACGGSKPPKQTTPELPEPKTVADKIVALLPPGAQIIVELDLARLRANPVVGEAFAKATAAPIDFPADLPKPPLAVADVVVLAAYGVGTSSAATIAVIAAPQDVPDAVRVRDGLFAMGPPEWLRQLEARAAIASRGSATARSGADAPRRSIDVPVRAEAALLELRERAMPKRAPGASLRVTARLSFDARVALARQSGLESAPARLSIWADVVDDFVIIIDADAVDPGEKATKKSIARLEQLIRIALRSLAEEPSMRALGLSSSISRARLSTGGSWIRTIIAVGPAHLKRVVERANSFLGGSS